MSPKSKRRPPSEGGAAQSTIPEAYLIDEILDEFLDAQRAYVLATSIAWTARRRRNAALADLEAARGES